MTAASQHDRTPSEVVIRLGPGLDLRGFLEIPPDASRIVVFVHGSGSSRFSIRNRQVAGFLGRRGCTTLLMDLLTPDEERVDAVTRELRFDIPMLAERVVGTLDWALVQPQLGPLPVGLFGASTGAAAALIAAAKRPDRVAAVVSRGGRPDLAGAWLAQVRAPTLLVVGSADSRVLQLNREAATRLPAESQLVTIPGATHLFEEPGTLDQVADAAAAWFERFVAPRRPASR